MGIESLQGVLTPPVRSVSGVTTFLNAFDPNRAAPLRLRSVYLGPAAVEVGSGLLGAASSGVQPEHAAAENPVSRKVVSRCTVTLRCLDRSGLRWRSGTPPRQKPRRSRALADPAALTAVLVGITEPLEFTFLFISPLLFAIHAVLAGHHGDGDVHLWRGGQHGCSGLLTSSCRKLDPHVP